MPSIDALKEGESARIETVTGSAGFINRAAAMGITSGVRVTSVQNQGRLPLLLHLRNSMVALDRKDAQRILIHDNHTL